MDKFPKIPMATFRIVGGVLSKEERNKHNRAKFSGLYLWDVNPSHVDG